jgi:cell division septum initiation protein DivIVA
MSAQLIDNLMEKIHVLTQENKRLKDENQTKTETIERLGSQIAESRSTGLEVTDHGTTNADAGVCSADCVVGLLRGQDGAEPVA